MISLREVKEAHPSNSALQLATLTAIYPEHELVSTGKYFPYNQLYHDNMWGCAWRAIQLMLTSQQIEQGEDFRKLFLKFAMREELMKTIQARPKFKRLPKEKVIKVKWAPAENSKNWAEPFIGQIICEFYKLDTEIFLLNGCPQSHADEQFFERTVDFGQFWQIIKRTIPDSPLMIDDGQLALSIIGYRQGSEGRKHLIMADPHIYSNLEYPETGIYEVTLNEKGKQIEHTLVDDLSKEKSFATHKEMEFEDKKWMVLRVSKNE